MNFEAPANLDFARKLIQHMVWEDRRVWRLAVAKLDDSQFRREVDLPGESIKRVCRSLMDTEARCLSSLTGERFAIEAFSDRDAMREEWQRLGDGWLRYADKLHDAAFEADCQLEVDGDIQQLRAWQLIFHAIYRGTAHKAEILRLAAEVDRAPQFDLSLMQYLTGVYRQ